MARTLLALVLVAVPAAAVAQPASPPSAAAVLAEVDKTYATIKTAKLAFEQDVTSATFGDTQHSRGSGWIARPDQMRWQYAPKQKKQTRPQKVFISDGVDLTVVDHLNIQVIQQPIGKNLTPAALSFLTGKGKLGAGFTPVVIASNATSHTLELTPNHQASAAYAKLTLVIDAATYEVRASIVEDSAGNTNRITFTKLETGVAIDPKLFVVNLKAKALRNYRLVRP